MKNYKKHSFAFIAIMAIAVLFSISSVLAATDAPQKLQGYGEFYKIDSVLWSGSVNIDWFYEQKDEEVQKFNVYVAEGNTEDITLFSKITTINTADDTLTYRKEYWYWAMVHGITSQNGEISLYITAENEEGESGPSNIIYLDNKNYNEYIYFTNYVENLTIAKDVEWTFDADAEANYEEANISYFLERSPKEATIDKETGLITWTPTHSGYFQFVVIARDLNKKYEAVLDFQLRVSNCNANTVIKGTVKDEEGNSIDYGYVLILNSLEMDKRDTLQFVTYTKFENGEYEITGLDEGKYYLMVEAYGKEFENQYYQMWWDGKLNYTEADPIEIGCGETKVANFVMKTIPLPNYYTVSGKVFDSQTLEPLAYSFVQFIGNNSQTNQYQMFFANTNQDGEYSLMLSDEFEYIAFANGLGKDESGWGNGYIPEYYNNVTDPSEATILKLTSDLSNIDFGLVKMAVYENTLKGFVKNESGSVLKDMIVIAYLVEPATGFENYMYYSKTANTDDLGAFSIDNLIPGKYILFAGNRKMHDMVYPGYYKEGSIAVLDWEAADRIEVGEDGIYGDFTINLKIVTKINGNGKVKGNVRKNGKSAKLSDGGALQESNALVGANIFITDMSDNKIKSTTTDNLGQFEIPNLSNGKYKIIADKVGFNTASSIVNISDNNAIITTDLDLEPNTASSVEDNNENSALVYPNPANTNAQLSFEATYGSAEIMLINPAGMLVSKSSVNTQTGLNATNLNVSEIATGKYIIIIKNGNSVTKIPFVIQR